MDLNNKMMKNYSVLRSALKYDHKKNAVQGKRLKHLSGLLAVAVAFNASALQSNEMPAENTLSLPSYNTTDRNSVNVATGAVSITQQDVAIGQGGLSLSHTIGTHTSDFVNFETYSGPADKFRGGLMKKHFRSRGNPGYFDDLFIAQYFDFEGSLDFEINGDGTFTPLYDALSSLVFANGMYTVTKANGTVVEIPGALAALQDDTYSTGPQGHTLNYDRIIYPNGFIISVERAYSGMTSPILSVTTNNGLQLKYNYVSQTRPLPAHLDKYIAWPGPNIPQDGVTWSDSQPASVVAINRGYEYCADTTACTLSQSWPTATYIWPDGMPKAAYVGPSVFSVIDAAGRTTDYHHAPVDIDIGAPGNPSTGTRFVSRLQSVKFAHETTPSVSYSYANIFDSTPIYQQFYFYRKNIGPATLVGASNKGNLFTYRVGANGTEYLTAQHWQHLSTGHKSVERYATDTHWNVPLKIELWDKDITFESQASGRNTTGGPLAPIINRVEIIENKTSKGGSSYNYDSRGHLTHVYQNDGTGSFMVSEARYPASCTNPKTCNQPTWVKDQRGYQTDYTYHGASGGVATVTLPANEQSIRAKTRYGYQQYYAWYKNSAGTLTQATSPVWLMSYEKTCRKGSTLSDNSGCSINGSEIVTTYHYGKQDGSVANNLWLKGVTVTADGESRTTCYTHDRLGNQLSETAPLAGLTTCN